MYTISLARKSVAKQSNQPWIFENTPEAIVWHQAEALSPTGFSKNSLLLDPLVELQKTNENIVYTTNAIIVRTSDPSKVYDHYSAYDHVEVPLNFRVQDEFNKNELSDEFQNNILKLSTYTQTSISVTPNFVLHIYGKEKNVAYCQYKLNVMLYEIDGFSIHRLELPFAFHSLISGRDRANLWPLYDHTGVNIIMPPNDPPNKVVVDEIYLVGNKAQILMASELLDNAVISKVMNSSPTTKDREVSDFVCDMLNIKYKKEIQAIMVKYGTFVQIPPYGRRGNLKFSVLGCSKVDIDSTISAVEKLSSTVYVAEFAALNVDQQIKLTANSHVSCYSSNTTQIYGLNTEVKAAIELLEQNTGVSVYMEQPVGLLDFILGKKQGKMSKVVNGTGTSISTEKLYPHSFHLVLSGQSSTSTLQALCLLENELPAEAMLHIPEVFHKQVIGQGGLTIQTLMRKYNVYMRFENTAKERYPNQLGNSHPENVLIRCPNKNKEQIERAAEELLQFVENLDKAHAKVQLTLPRSDRRLLLAMRSGVIRDVEINANVAVRIPTVESMPQLVTISGQTKEAVEEATNMLKENLQSINYEFRIPWSPRFTQVVGNESSFAEDVVAPLYLELGAEVQTFEEVKMMDDEGVYSQIVVSLLDRTDSFGKIFNVITNYLRVHKFDIVDYGEISTNAFNVAGVDELNEAIKSKNSDSNTVEIMHTQENHYIPSIISPHRNALENKAQPQILRSILQDSPVRPLMSTPRAPQIRVYSNNETPIKRKANINGNADINRRPTAAVNTAQPKLDLKPRRAATKYNRLF